MTTERATGRGEARAPSVCGARVTPAAIAPHKGMVEKATHSPVRNLIAFYEQGTPAPAKPKAPPRPPRTADAPLREATAERSQERALGTPDRTRAPAPSTPGPKGNVMALRMEELSSSGTRSRSESDSAPLTGTGAKSANPSAIEAPKTPNMNVVDSPKVPADISMASLDRPYPEGTPNLKFGSYELHGFRDRTFAKSNGYTKFAEFHDKSSGLQDSSWKAHISVDPNQLGAAWDIIGPELMKAGVPHFKVTRPVAIAENANHMAQVAPEVLPQLLKDDERLTRGMQVTVYLPEGQEKATLKVLEGLEKKLKKAGISPGKIDGSDDALGKFTSVRNDGGPTNYSTHDKSTKQKLPFKHF